LVLKKITSKEKVRPNRKRKKLQKGFRTEARRAQSLLRTRIQQNSGSHINRRKIAAKRHNARRRKERASKTKLEYRRTKAI